MEEAVRRKVAGLFVVLGELLELRTPVDVRPGEVQARDDGRGECDDERVRRGVVVQRLAFL